MKLVILIHGYNVWDGGRATVGKLRPFFAEHSVPYIMLDYDHFGLIDVRFKNKGVAKRLSVACTNARAAGFEVVVVGHSNGCAIMHQAAHEFDAKIDKAVYINPALDADAEPANTVRSLDVWYSPSDKPVMFSKWLLHHPWGDMGAKGYIGGSDKVASFNKESGYFASSKEHSDMFSMELLPTFAPIVVSRALNSWT